MRARVHPLRLLTRALFRFTEDYGDADRVPRPFTGRSEDFHVSFQGVSYDPADETQMVFIDGILSPPDFDSNKPNAHAPAGGWPVLLLLPAGGSAEVEEGPRAALEELADVRFVCSFWVLVLGFDSL